MVPSRLRPLSVVHFQSTLFQTKGQNLIVPVVSFFLRCRGPRLETWPHREHVASLCTRVCACVRACVSPSVPRVCRGRGCSGHCDSAE